MSNLGGFRIFLAEKNPAIPREGDIRTTLSRGGGKSGNDLRVPGSMRFGIPNVPHVAIGDFGPPSNDGLGVSELVRSYV